MTTSYLVRNFFGNQRQSSIQGVAQFYTWKIVLYIIYIIGVDTNIIRILISFVVCTLIAIIMHEVIEKPLKKIISKKIIM